MLINISDNNVQKIKEALGANPVECAFLIDYAANIESFFKFIEDINPGIKKIFVFTDGKPNLKTKKSKIEKWSIADYIKFLTSAKRVQFNNHQPVYDRDESRISGWRLYYAMGPLRRISKKICSFIPCRRTTKIINYILGCAGLIAQILIPPLRWEKGRLDFRRAQTDICIFFDDGPEKDHYGESPLMEDRLAAFESAVLSVKDRRIGFFVVTGPRHQYIDRVLALETQGRLQNFAIYAAGMFRPESFKAVENVKAGAFSPGSNISIFNKIIYSDHCLSIGAGDKELWCYRTANSHD